MIQLIAIYSFLCIGATITWICLKMHAKSKVENPWGELQEDE